MSDRPLLVVEKLRRALDAVNRFDKLTNEEIDRIVDETLGEVPELIKVEALSFVADQWEQEKIEKLSGWLAAWQPSEDELRRPQ
jgi:hypothetical protein